MQKKQFPMARSSERQRQQLYSEESEESLARKKEIEKMNKKLQNLKSLSEIVLSEVQRNWKQVQEYEASKLIEAAKEANTMQQKNFANYKYINRQIFKISDRIKRLHGINMGPLMEKSYEIMQAAESNQYRRYIQKIEKSKQQLSTVPVKLQMGQYFAKIMKDQEAQQKNEE